MNIIGIDPSLTATGFCNHNGRTWVVGTKEPTDDRLVVLWAEAQLAATDMDLAMVEDLPVHGHAAGKTGMAQGVIRLTLLDLQVPYITVTPGTLKKFATGRGTATKADMRMELFKRAGLDLPDDNEVDAYWLRMIGLVHYGEGLTLPKTHTDALVKIDWRDAPELVA